MEFFLNEEKNSDALSKTQLIDEFDEPLPYEPERNYLPIENFKLDWNMMLYGADENGDEIDWNKLVYNDDQLLEFNLQKQEKILRPEYYEYLFKKNSERSELEKYFLRQSGFGAYDDDSDEELEINRVEKRLVINNILRSA